MQQPVRERSRQRPPGQLWTTQTPTSWRPDWPQGSPPLSGLSLGSRDPLSMEMCHGVGGPWDHELSERSCCVFVCTSVKGVGQASPQTHSGPLSAGPGAGRG